MILDHATWSGTSRIQIFSIHRLPTLEPCPTSASRSSIPKLKHDIGFIEFSLVMGKDLQFLQGAPVALSVIIVLGSPNSGLMRRHSSPH
jgi:hypothetical protein